MYHTESISGDVSVMKNCDSTLWVLCVIFRECCSPDACCLMSDSPPMRYSERPPTCFAVRFVNVSTDAVKPRACLFPLTSVAFFWRRFPFFPPVDCCERTETGRQAQSARRSQGMFMLAGGPACLPPEHFCCLYYFLCFILFITVKFSVDV